MEFKKNQIVLIGGEAFGKEARIFYRATVWKVEGKRVFVDFDGYVCDFEKPSMRYFFLVQTMREWHARYVNKVAGGEAVQVLVTRTVEGVEGVETIVELVAEFAPEVAARRAELQLAARPPAAAHRPTAAARTRSPGKVAPTYAPSCAPRKTSP